MQSASSRIWTRVTVSISYDDNYYTTGLVIIVLNIFFPIWDMSSSSSSCRATSTDIPDPVSPLLPIAHHLWQVFRATSRILT